MKAIGDHISDIDLLRVDSGFHFVFTKMASTLNCSSKRLSQVRVVNSRWRARGFRVDGGTFAVRPTNDQLC